MPHPRFALLVGTFHVLFGAFFFLFTGFAVHLFIETPGQAALVIVKGLSGICFAFELMNLMACNIPDGPALTAVLVGTLFYLLFTTGCNMYWIRTGVLMPLTWASIALRAVFEGVCVPAGRAASAYALGACGTSTEMGSSK